MTPASFNLHLCNVIPVVRLHCQKNQMRIELLCGQNDLRKTTLLQASADELDPKLKCNVSESLATSIAKNLSLRLSDYILYA